MIKDGERKKKRTPTRSPTASRSILTPGRRRTTTTSKKWRARQTMPRAFEPSALSASVFATFCTSCRHVSFILKFSASCLRAVSHLMLTPFRRCRRTPTSKKWRIRQTMPVRSNPAHSLLPSCDFLHFWSAHFIYFEEQRITFASGLSFIAHAVPPPPKDDDVEEVDNKANVSPYVDCEVRLFNLGLCFLLADYFEGALFSVELLVSHGRSPVAFCSTLTPDRRSRRTAVRRRRRREQRCKRSLSPFSRK